jgi:hypothetical protein
MAAWLTAARLRDAAFCLLFGLIVVVIQYRSAAFTADLASIDDEPAHAVSSLLVHDYLVQAFPHNPLPFARSFYAHYPKVAIGHWPPLFYLAEGLWMLFAGRSQVALLLFVALCGAALFSSVFFVVRRESSTAAALVSVAVMTGSRIFHWVLFGVEPEALLALTIFWATIHCSEFMSTGSRRSRNFFLVLTTAALLIHQRGAILFLLPFTLLPLRSRIVKWKWLTAGAVVLALFLIPPHFHLAARLAWSKVLPHVWVFIRATVRNTGWPWLVVAVIAMPLVFRQSRERRFWAAMAGLAVSSLALNLLLPVQWEYRYFLISSLTLAVFAGGGIHVLLEQVSRYRQALSLTVSVAAIGWIIWSAANGPAKPDLGYRKMVQNCLLCNDEVALIAGDALDEGGLIVEASLWDPNRLHTVLRASKTLEVAGPTIFDKPLLYSTSAQVLHELDQEHVTLILVQTEYREDLRAFMGPQVAQLRTALEQAPAEWRLVPGASQVKSVEIYRRAPAQDVPSNGPAR